MTNITPHFLGIYKLFYRLDNVWFVYRNFKIIFFKGFKILTKTNIDFIIML